MHDERAGATLGSAKRDFAVDRAKGYTIVLSGVDAPWQEKLPYVLLDSEFHCVAVYRLGQYAAELRQRHPRAGVFVIVAHRVLNRWISHVDHAEINRRAQIGPGLILTHRHGILIGPVVIGRNCAIHQNVTIGERMAAGDKGVPTIGNDVWIGPGAVITGAITVGDGVTISAGTVLSKDVPAGCLVAGNPARVVLREYDNSEMLKFRVPPEI